MKPKLNNETELIITRKVNEFVDQNGVHKVQVRREIARGPLDLGSIKEPKNKDVVSIEYRNKNPMGQMFGGFFK